MVGLYNRLCKQGFLARIDEHRQRRNRPRVGRENTQRNVLYLPMLMSPLYRGRETKHWLYDTLHYYTIYDMAITSTVGQPCKIGINGFGRIGTFT